MRKTKEESMKNHAYFVLPTYFIAFLYITDYQHDNQIKLIQHGVAMLSSCYSFSECNAFKKNIAWQNSSIHNIYWHQTLPYIGVPRFLVYILVAIWCISLVTIFILGFKVSQMEAIRQEAYKQGRDDIVCAWRGYFDENPEVYKTYNDWKSKIDSITREN